jgi:hypothetical protein
MTEWKKIDVNKEILAEPYKNLDGNIFADPILFAKKLLKFDPHPYQERILKACVEKKRVAAICARQSGKSTTVSIFCLFWAVAVPNQQIVIVSPTQKQSGHLFDMIRGHIFNSRYLTSETVENYKTKITFKNGSQIHSLTVGSSGKSIRGHTANILVMEESAFIKDSIVNEVIMPMLASTDKKGGTVIQIGTPIGRNHFWEVTRRDSGYEVIHVTYRECVDVGQYDQDFVDDQKRRLNPDQFAREYLATFTESEGAALPYDFISPVIYPDLGLVGTPDRIDTKIYTNFYLGVDLGRYGSSTVISVLAEDTNGVLNLILQHEMRKASFKKQVANLKYILRYVKAGKIGIDATGMGMSFVESLKNDGMANIIPVMFNTKTKQEMMQSFRKVVKERKIRLPEHKNLITQMIEQEYRVNSQGNEIYSPPEHSHDDRLWSLLIGTYVCSKSVPIHYVRVNS